MAENQFRQATDLFYRAEYAQGLPFLTKIINSQGPNSNLLLNQGIFLSQLQHEGEARNSIVQALKLNPRNYIAYFNLFSLDFRLRRDREALHHLCCSLSCLYVMKAKSDKIIELANKAIEYCSNNTEAHLLKGLLLLGGQSYSQAFSSLNQAVNFDPRNPILKQLRSYAFTLAYPNGTLIISGQQMKNEAQPPNRLLHSSYQVEDDKIQEQINAKLIEFNQLYMEIGSSIDSVTELIPQQKDSTSVHYHRSHLRHSRNQEEPSGVVMDDPGQDTPPLSQARVEAANIYLRQSKVSFKERSRLSLLSMKEESEFKSIQGQSKEAESGDEFVSIIEEHEDKKDQEQNLQSQTLKQSREDATKEEIGPVEDCNLIYPLDELVKLEISVLSLQLFPEREQSMTQLTDVYCILNYNGGKTKLRTQTTACNTGLCIWNQEFKAVDIAQEPSDLKIKVYNKKYNSFRDQYLGDIEVLITTADLLRLPVFDKKGTHLGSLVIRLRLQESVPHKEDISECQQ